MNKVEVSELENIKLEKEIEKLDAEIKSLKSSQWRAWLISFSILVGVIVSIFGLLQALSEINQKNQQLTIESQIRSHEILITQVLDKFSGVRISHLERDPQGKMIEKMLEMWTPTVQRTAYAAAVSLAKKFPDLKPIVVVALTEQLATIDEPIAQKYLTELEK